MTMAKTSQMEQTTSSIVTVVMGELLALSRLVAMQDAMALPEPVTTITATKVNLIFEKMAGNDISDAVTGQGTGLGLDRVEYRHFVKELFLSPMYLTTLVHIVAT